MKKMSKNRAKFLFKVGDSIKVIAGNDKGKISTITHVLRKISKIIVKDVNFKTKHIKSTKEGENGKIEIREFPIHISNIMLCGPKQIASRFNIISNNNGNKIRKLIKTGEYL
uniref:Large ribosomal subunit protein uL24c n=1 Tax=Cyanidium sp. THAL103 TaxID=3027999 RepID=A0A9Y1MXY8_9RHOD|nr:ribosomal protein L24 [Cyanidium sp. THAL103]